MPVGEALAHGGGAAGGGEASGIDAARPQGDALDAVLAQFIEHGMGCTKIDRCAVVARAKEAPDLLLEKPQFVVVQIRGQVSVVRDDERQPQSAALSAATVIKSRYAEQCGV